MKNRISEPIEKLFYHGLDQKKGHDEVAKTRFAIIGLDEREKKLALSTIRHFYRLQDNSTMSLDQNEFRLTLFLDNSSIIIEFFFFDVNDPDDMRKLLCMEFTGAFVTEENTKSGGDGSILGRTTERVGRFPSMRDGGPTNVSVLGFENEIYMEYRNNEIRTNE